ncbi:MAG: GlxA family transcriptional regulator [Pseudomonadota bacterium]
MNHEVSDIRRVDILLVPQFSNLTFAAVVEPMRVANMMLGRLHFNWRLLSESGEPVSTSSGLQIGVDGGIGDASDQHKPCDALFVIASFDAQRQSSEALCGYVRRVARRGSVVGGLESGAYVLAEAGVLDDYRATIHWEDWPNFSERFPRVKTVTDRFVLDRKRFTTGGALPALDFMLYLIQQLFGLPVALAVSASFIYEQSHTPDEAQHSLSAGLLHWRDAQLVDAIRLMENNIESPLTVAEIADQIGISTRELQRRFQTILKTTPVNYYASLRLSIGMRMVENSNRTINDIALQCGYSSGSAFSRVFRSHFGRAPLDLRRQRPAE